MGNRHESVKHVIEFQRGEPVGNPSNPALKGSQRAQRDHLPDRQAIEKEQQGAIEYLAAIRTGPKLVKQDKGRLTTK